MRYFFSAKELGFFNDEVNEVMPDDVIEVSDEVYQSLLDGQGSGKVISTDSSGAPILTDPKGPTHDELVAVAEAERSDLMKSAEAAIAPLQRAVKYGIASESEKKLLEQWEVYTVLLSRLDATKTPDIEWPPVPDIQTSISE